MFTQDGEVYYTAGEVRVALNIAHTRLKQLREMSGRAGTYTGRVLLFSSEDVEAFRTWLIMNVPGYDPNRPRTLGRPREDMPALNKAMYSRGEAQSLLNIGQTLMDRVRKECRPGFRVGRDTMFSKDDILVIREWLLANVPDYATLAAGPTRRARGQRASYVNMKRRKLVGANE